MKTTRDARVYRRTPAILEADRGTSVTRIAATLGVARQGVYNRVEDYLRDHDPAASADAPRMGRPGFRTEESRRLPPYLLDHSPEEFGYPGANWTLGLLCEQLDDGPGREPSEDTVRRESHRLGYVRKRPRYVLKPDPGREEKTPDPPADPGPARPQRRPGRGRDGAAAVPAPAGRVVARRATLPGAPLGAE